MTLLTTIQAWAHPEQVHIKFLVVVCQYADTETPELHSQQWADELNLGINTLYSTATHQQASEFEFIPIPGVLVFDFPYGHSDQSSEGSLSLIHDKAVIDREGIAALKYAKQRAPEYFSEPVYLLTIVNRFKEGRARAMFDFPLRYADQGSLKVMASISVIADPIAGRRFTFPPPSSNEEDQDGDGLSDEFESLQGTLPNQSDSDGDGYSDWAELALGVSDPLDPVSKLSLPDQTISHVAHMVGHQIGLPGLHPDGRYVTEHSMGYWGLMSMNNSQGLSGFTRLHSQWLDKVSGELVIDIDSNGLDEPLFYLVEPSFQFIGRFLPPGVFELVRIRRPSLPDLLLEARPKFGVDASRTADGFSSLGNISGLPTAYQPGVLISQIHSGYDRQTFPYPGLYHHPVVQVLPHQLEGDSENEQAPSPEQLKTLETATIQEQQMYRDTFGLEIQVGQFDRFEGSYEVTVQSGSVPSFSDLAITEAWLDSSANGFSYFAFGTDESSLNPKRGGDPVHLKQQPFIKWIDSKPEVGLRTGSFEHQVVFQVKNIGTAEALGIQGNIYILPADTLPIGDSIFDPVVLDALDLANQTVLIERLKPDQLTEISMSFFPESPIQAILMLNQASNEQVTHNNLHRSVFWTEYSTLETFFPSIETSIQVYNGSSFSHHLVAQVSDVPEGWEGTLTLSDMEDPKWFSELMPGGFDTFEMQWTPPPPRDVPIGTIAEMQLETWVDYGDTDVTAGNLPMTVVLSLPCKITLDVATQAHETFVTGVLLEDSPEQLGLSDAVVSIEWVSSIGDQQTLLTTTTSDGAFSFGLPSDAELKYAGVVQFHGNTRYAPTQSNPIEWGQSNGLPVVPIRLSATLLPNDGIVELEISNALSRNLALELQFSNDLVHWQEMDQKQIPPGNTILNLLLETTDQSTFFRMVNGEW